MGKALELITGIVTAPGATATNLTMASGNSLTVRNAAPSSKIKLVNMWSFNATVGISRLRSPQLHDNVQGIRYRVPVGGPQPYMTYGNMQKLMAQDTLQSDLTGGGAGEIDTSCLLVAYDDLPGVAGTFISSDEMRQRVVNMVTVENTIAAGILGNYSGQEAINAEFDLLHANTDYAIVGYVVNVACAAVRWLSSDFGNLGLGGPGNLVEKALTANWFDVISRKSGMPLIPVFNSANASSVLIDVAQDDGGVDVTVNTILAQLS